MPSHLDFASESAALKPGLRVDDAPAEEPR
jgi:hypothetical protein